MGVLLMPDRAPDLDALLAGIDAMATRRPVAARIVCVTNSEDADAKDLARVLLGDARLAGKVMRLANSAHFGMSGRVTSLQYAIAVVGFTTVRTLATVALTDTEDGPALPDDFWDVSAAVALAASMLAPRFGEYPPDALCLGLLAQLGTALLHAADPAGHAELVAAEPEPPGRRAAEARRYGISGVGLSAEALERWSFPAHLVAPMRGVDDRSSLRGALLRSAFEVAMRSTGTDREPVPVGPLSCRTLTEDDVARVLPDVRAQAADLRRALADD